ncbi:MAG: CbiX/SirB N-terminal domain-containing protein [Propionicimonas sp.]
MSPSTPMPPPLVIAGHGTRDQAGAALCAELVQRVRGLLPDVRVEAGFVELTPPGIDTALAEVLTTSSTAVVVPLMIGTGGHVREDIPEAIEAGRRAHPDATVVYTRHLGSPRGLIEAVRQRIDSAVGDWDAAEVAVVVVGRGCSVTEANADHVRLGRILFELGGYHRVVPAFIQVARPSVADALSEAYTVGARRLVIMPNFLFPGRLATWVAQQAAAWQADFPEAEVRIAGVIGPCGELAELVAQRYREGALRVRAAAGSPSYLAGLLLNGRRVVVVGGGCVSRRRVPKLVTAGAQVTVVSPFLHQSLVGLAEAGALTWLARGYEPGDLAGAWYAMAATDSPTINAAVAAEAEAQRTFCVRVDAAEAGTAWTPATGELDGVTIAAIASHDPLRSRRLRDRFLAILAEEEK